MLTRLGALIQTSKAVGGVAPVIGEWGLAGDAGFWASGAVPTLVQSAANAQHQLPELARSLRSTLMSMLQAYLGTPSPAQ